MGENESAEIVALRKSLQRNPKDFDNCNALGNALKNERKFAEAVQWYRKATSLPSSPLNHAIVWCNMAGAYKDSGDVTNALQCYEKSVSKSGQFPDAFNNMGNVLKDLGRLLDARSAYEKAIKLNPKFACAIGNLGTTYQDSGDFERAIELYRSSLSIDASQPDTYNNMGIALKELGRLHDAITTFRQGLKFDARHASIYNNLANTLKDVGSLRESGVCYQVALRICPTFAALHNNYAALLKEQGQLESAISHYEQAISLDANYADAYSNLGNAYKDQQQMDRAIAMYRKALELRPAFAEAMSNLGSVFKDTARVPEAIQCYKDALAIKSDFPDAMCNLIHSQYMVSDWSSRDVDFASLSTLLDRQIRAHQTPSIQPQHALSYPITAEQLLAINKCYAARATTNVSHIDLPYTPSSPTQRPPLAEGERLRLGYCSSDFGDHPLSHLMQSVFGMHSRDRVEVFCYALTPDDKSTYRAKIQAEAEHFEDISQLSPRDAAVRMHDRDRLHVLIDLNGYTKGSRTEIFALQPAPVQCSYMGFCGTSGASYIQYYIGDHVANPPYSDSHFTESIIRLPNCYFVNDHMQFFNPPPVRSFGSNSVTKYFPDTGQTVTLTRAQYGLPDDKVVLANLNQLHKIDPDTFDVWVRIIKGVPNSVLWLLRFGGLGLLGEENIRQEARRRGLTDDQVVFTDVVSKQEHVQRCALADLFLDTPLYNAHTIGTDVLWAGVPMVTLPLTKMAQRVGASLSAALGCPEFIVDSLAAYEHLAIRVASDPEMLSSWRRKVEERRLSSPLFDTKNWVRLLEQSLLQVWHAADNSNTAAAAAAVSTASSADAASVVETQPSGEGSRPSS